MVVCMAAILQHRKHMDVIRDPQKVAEIEGCMCGLFRWPLCMFFMPVTSIESHIAMEYRACCTENNYAIVIVSHQCDRSTFTCSTCYNMSRVCSCRLMTVCIQG